MKFQQVLLTIFGIVAVVAAAVFSLIPSKGGDPTVAGATGNVVVWGTFPSTRVLGEVFSRFNETYKESFSVSYEFHDPKSFDNEVVEALASGRGPDILLLPDDLVLRHSDKIERISYQSVPEETFRSTFVQASEIYMRDDGLLALPFAIDPMVMYWNRDLFNNSSVAEPPRYWDELLLMTPRLTKRNPKTSEITQSAVAFGEYINVTHAKDVLAMLFLQVGNPLVSLQNGIPLSKIVTGTGNQLAPAVDVVSAFRFFMDFSNPQKPNYTWSRARASSFNEFISGNLAMHFDYASAYKLIQQKNPHLNFAAAQVPLPRGTKAEITFTKVYGLAVPKSSKNKQTAFIAAQHLLGDLTPERDFAAAVGLPPVLRTYLAKRPTDAAFSVFYDAAIRGRTWLDPNPTESGRAFQAMVESASSGRSDTTEAVRGFNADLDSLLIGYR